MMWMEFLAQVTETTSSGGTFDEVISRIIVWLCGIFFIWGGLMFFLMRRAKERRRREKEGLEPLPPISVSIREWFNRMTQAPTEPPRPSSPSALDDLLAELPDKHHTEDDFDIHALLRGETAKPQQAPLMDNIVEYEDKEAITSAAAQIPTSVVAQTRAPIPPAIQNLPDDAVEVLKVWRDVTDGGLIVQMKDLLFSRLEQIPDGATAHRYLNILQQLMDIADIQAGVAAPAPVIRPAVSAKAAEEKKSAPSAPSEMGIAGEIELFLQHRLSAHPAFQNLNLHVHPSSDGGVRIEVNGELYEGVDAIPDDDVRTFLMNVIEEWSNQT
jgi:hypothetical protein